MPICSKLPQLHKVPVSQCLYSLCQVFGEGAIFPETTGSGIYLQNPGYQRHQYRVRAQRNFPNTG